VLGIPTEKEGVLMRGTKLCLLAFALAFVVALPGTMAAQDGKATLAGGIAMYNACTNNTTIVYAPGSTAVDYHQNGSQVKVHVLFHNDGTDLSSQNPYRLNLEANAQFNAAANTYDLPYHSVWASQNGTGDFTMDGTLRVWVKDGKPVTSQLLSWNLACAQQ